MTILKGSFIVAGVAGLVAGGAFGWSSFNRAQTIVPHSRLTRLEVGLLNVRDVSPPRERLLSRECQGKRGKDGLEGSSHLHRLPRFYTTGAGRPEVRRVSHGFVSDILEGNWLFLSVS